MWRVYRSTRNADDYINYKEALNAAATEIRTSKRSVFMHMSGVNKTYETRLDYKKTVLEI